MIKLDKLCSSLYVVKTFSYDTYVRPFYIISNTCMLILAFLLKTITSIFFFLLYFLLLYLHFQFFLSFQSSLSFPAVHFLPPFLIFSLLSLYIFLILLFFFPVLSFILLSFLSTFLPFIPLLIHHLF